MTRRTFFAPNDRSETLRAWQQKGRLQAVGTLMLNGCLMRGIDLASALGISPRGLRPHLVDDKMIKAEIHNGETWYRLVLARMPPPAIAPPETEKRRRLMPPTTTPRTGNCVAVVPAQSRRE